MLAFLPLLVLILFVESLWAQDRSPSLAPAVSSESAETTSLDTQGPQQILPPEQSGTSSTGRTTKQSDVKSAGYGTAPANQGAPRQPKRILGVMPNFRTVSAGAIPPPPTPKNAFIIATRNSFDYSSSIAALSTTAAGGSAGSLGTAVSGAADVEAAGESTADAEGQGTQPSGAQAPGEQSESAKPAPQNTPPPQPKRILGIMPNFRAVSAGTIPPPPTPKQAFVIATKNSFDYSSFIFVGITSAFAEWTDAHPQLGQGMPGYGRYYWRGFVDKADGNYWVIFALPTVFHQDERYYAMGKGGIWKRGIYAASRILITPDYHGHNGFNASEILGRGIAQGISLAYYPSGTGTAGALASKYGWAIGRDVLTNVFREFWPDIATHVLHRHP